MVDQLRTHSEDDSQRSDWETRQAWQNSGKVRALKSRFTKFEMQVITLIYYEACTVKECGYVLEVSESTIKKIIWLVADKILME